MTTLTLRVALAADPPARPELRYRLDNREGPGLAVYNHLFKQRLDGARTHRASLAYVDLDGKVARVQKRRIKPVLPGASIEAPHLSYLPAGAALEETILLPLPLRACNPARRLALLEGGRRADVLIDVPRRIDQVELVIEAYPVESPGESLTLIRPGPGPKVYRPRLGSPGEGSLFTAAAALPAPIDALDYRLVPG